MAVDAWHRTTIVSKGTKLLLLSPSKLDEEDVQMDINNDVPHAGAPLRYQVRVFTRDMSAMIVEQVLGLSTDYEIISVTRQATRQSEAYDSNYYLVVFESDTCPAQLKGVTHITAGKYSVYIHHFLRHSRVPCFRCYDPNHSNSQCKAAAGVKAEEHPREFEMPLPPMKPIPRQTIRHMNTAGRLNLVNDTANALKLIRTKLKAAASKKPLLHKLDATSAAQHTDLAQTVPEPAEPTVPSSEAAINDSNGWVDPANSRLGKGQFSVAAADSASRPAVLVNTSATTAAKNSDTTTSTDKTAKRNTNGASTPPIAGTRIAQKQQTDKTSVVRPEADRPKKADRSKKTAATARRTAEAALAAVLAGEDYSKQASEHAQAENETERKTVLPDEAFAKAENVAQQDEAAVRKATTLCELKITAAQTPKTRYQAEAATAHTEGLRRAKRADKADNKSELPQAERNVDKVRIQEIMEKLVVMDQQRVKAETEAKMPSFGSRKL